MHEDVPCMVTIMFLVWYILFVSTLYGYNNVPCGYILYVSTLYNLVHEDVPCMVTIMYLVWVHFVCVYLVLLGA